MYTYIYTYNYIDIDIDLDSWIYNLDISIFGIPKLDISQRFAAFNGGRWPWYGTGWRTGSPRCRAWAGCARPASWAERLKPIDSWDVVDDPQNEDIMCDIYIYMEMMWIYIYNINRLKNIYMDISDISTYRCIKLATIISHQKSLGPWLN